MTRAVAEPRAAACDARIAFREFKRIVGGLELDAAESRRLAGVADGALPLGVEANRKSLRTAIHYAVQQHLIPRRFEVDELFDEVTLEPGE